jgi:CRP-like cAMP-binding protein
MISPELLRSYPYFAGLSEEYLNRIAKISEKKDIIAGEEILREGNPARFFCLMVSGEVNVVYRLGDDREVIADSLIKGDPFGWSALLQPHKLTASCRGSKDGAYIRIEAEELRAICDENIACGYRIAQEVSKTLRNRLSALRTQIAASR